MDTKSRECPIRERKRRPCSKFAQRLRSFVGHPLGKHSPHQDQSQSRNPHIPRLPELPNNPWEPSYPATHRKNHTDIWGAPPLITTEYHRYLPPEVGQQACTIPPQVPGTEIIIALMGVTGAGKSHFIKEVTGNSEVEVSSDLCSCTREVQAYSFEYAGAIITLVDTPGSNDTERTDTQVLQEIADWTSTTYREGQLLSGIIYLHPITHTRMQGSAMRSLRTFQSLCGQQVLQNVFLTTTQWSNVNLAEAELRENRLRNQDFWGGLICKGATLERFYGTRESGLELIHKLVLNIPKSLDIQHQIVEQNMTLLETNAGKCINEELIAQEKKFKEQLDSLENKLAEVIGARSREVKILMGEQAETQNKLEKALAERRSLAGLHVAEAKKPEARKREEEARSCYSAVIAVDIKDIASTGHITGESASYKTKGRLILDINNHEEFNSDTIGITIDYQLTLLSGIRGYRKTFREVFDVGFGDTNYIALDGVYYRCKSGTLMKVGSQKFVMFSKR